MNEYKGRIEDSEGNILYPHTKASVTFMSDGKNVEDALKDLDNVQNFGVATQVEAEAGTSATKYMTPQRTRNAIDARSMLVTKQFLTGSSINYNTVTTSGIYKVGDVTGSTGAPPLNYGILEVKNPEQGYVLQEFTSFNGEKFVRFADGVSWSAWRQVQFIQQAYDNWNAGFETYTRFPGTCKIIYDWNAINLNGMYMGAEGTPNAPTTEWYMGTVTVHNDLFVIQKVMGVTNGLEYERRKNNGVWGPWVEITPSKLFTSVSNGKTAIASAISDGGVYTSPVETFANMANNIRLLYGSGLRMARGWASGTTRIDVPAGTFGFTPKLVLTRGGVLNAGFIGMYSPPNTGLLGGSAGDAFQGAAGRGGHTSAAEEIMFNSSVRAGGFNVQVAPSNHYPLPAISFEWIALG